MIKCFISRRTPAVSQKQHSVFVFQDCALRSKQGEHEIRICLVKHFTESVGTLTRTNETLSKGKLLARRMSNSPDDAIDVVLIERLDDAIEDFGDISAF